MKNLSVFFLFFVSIFSYGQVNEFFSDGNFTENPVWSGTAANFAVNASFQLQSKAAAASTSYLFTASEAMDDATWDCWVKITYNPSSSNYASVYLATDRSDISAGCNGYFVQIGGTNDEVSLYVQEGTKKTKIIDGVDKRTDRNPVEVRIRVTRDAYGNFKLYSKLSTETEYVLDGETQNLIVKQSAFFGLMLVNTATTGSAYYFDEVVVTGRKALDLEAPHLLSFSLEQPNKLTLIFSEAMDFSKSIFTVDEPIGAAVSQVISADKTAVSLTFGSDFERGKLYHLQITGLMDLAGNALVETTRSFGITERTEPGDLVLNEIMFENAEGSVEYLEIFNRSEKFLDVSGLVFTSRKTDGSLNSGNAVPKGNSLLPGAYLVLCEDADSVRNYYECPSDAQILSTGWSSLNNESVTVVLCNSAKDTVYDELTYSVKWHHQLVKNPKGVALERINPDLPTQEATSWHSAASEVKYGTPGYLNSQYRDVVSIEKSEKMVWVDPESFSPDNDGVDDVCFIRYKTDVPGYVANAQILNAVGNKVFCIASNVLLAAEGFLTWDGRTTSGKLANPGIYVLYFEMINPTTGRKSAQKTPIVLSTR